MLRRWALPSLGLAAGFSGIAVVAAILTGRALATFEAGLVVFPLVAGLVVVRRAPLDVRSESWRVVRAGLLAGFIATLAYDVVRVALAAVEPSPYRPFEAIRQFGLGFWATSTHPVLVLATGFLVHFVNGASFGVIYAVFAGRFLSAFLAAAVCGIAWGATLEIVQSILYPGWLNITATLREFLVISALGHVAYGLTLGISARRLLQRSTEAVTA